MAPLKRKEILYSSFLKDSSVYISVFSVFSFYQGVPPAGGTNKILRAPGTRTKARCLSFLAEGKTQESCQERPGVFTYAQKIKELRVIQRLGVDNGRGRIGPDSWRPQRVGSYPGG